MNSIRNVVYFTLTLLLMEAQVVAGRQANNFDISRLSDKGRIAYGILEGATVFRLGTVGYAGTISREQIALDELMEEPEATEALKRLCQNATPEGTLYGMLGLRIKGLLAPPQNERLARSNPQPDDETTTTPLRVEIEEGTVLTQSGCIVMRADKQAVSQRIAVGMYDLHFRRASVRN